MKIARKACRHCAFTKHHLGIKEEICEVLGTLALEGKLLQCHEYSEPTICASHANKEKVKGERQAARGDLKQKYTYITKQEKDRCGLRGVISVETELKLNKSN